MKKCVYIQGIKLTYLTIITVLNVYLWTNYLFFPSVEIGINIYRNLIKSYSIKIVFTNEQNVKLAPNKQSGGLWSHTFFNVSKIVLFSLSVNLTVNIVVVHSLWSNKRKKVNSGFQNYSIFFVGRSV